MKLSCISIVVITLIFIGQATAAMRRPTQRVVRSTVALPATEASGLVVLPFAVPVAVPVTVISQPAVLYSYRQYAAPNAGQSDHDAPTTGQAPTTREAPLTTTPAAAAIGPAVPSTDPAAALLTSRCAKCHTGAAPPGYLQIFDAAGQIMPKLPRRAILEMVSPDASGRQRMPPKDLPKLTADELATLSEWARPPKDLKY